MESQNNQSVINRFVSIVRIGIGRYIQYSKDSFATDIFKQSILGSQIIAVLLLLSFMYGLSFELQNNNQPNISLNIVQIILSFFMIILPYIIKDLRRLSNIFSILVFILAIAEIETQFHDVYLEFFDAKSWLVNLALMAAFAFFYVGTPLQFSLVWTTAFIFYTLRSLIETQFQIPTRLATMLSTIVPLAAIWIVLNGFWFRIRLKQLHIQADLTIANQKLTEIDRLRSNFFAGISHEFRTPLTLMLSPLQDMLTEAKNSHWLTEYLRSVERNGSRLLVLVNNLIDLARIDAGRMHLRLESIDLCQHIRGIISLFDQSFKSKGLTLKALLPLQLNVQIDVEKFETILMNLLINALHLTKSGGANIQLDVNQNQLWLTVTDTGTGIPKADKDLIFEYFATLYPSRQYAGLGLALSREFARFLGGDLKLVSTGAEGSTFLLNLPIRPTTTSHNRQAVFAKLPSMPALISEPKETYLPIDTNSNGHLILIVEENKELRNYLCRILSEQFQLEAVQNTQEALDYLSKNTPDLVISDSFMPNSETFKLIQKFRQNKAVKHIPFLFLTTKTTELPKGIDDYLVKPFDQSELLRKASRLIRRKSAEEERIRHERQSLVGDLHDMVGSDLTDLIILLDSLKAEPTFSSKIEHAQHLAKSALSGLRGQIHQREDLELIHNNFMNGIKIILHRRYDSANRRVRFNFQNEQQELFNRDIKIDIGKLLYSIFLEITSNDLKYGVGISNWKFSYQDSILEAYFISNCEKYVNGRLSFANRLIKDNGQHFEEHKQNQYHFHLSLPIR